MARKLALVLVAVILPGGLVALLGAWLFRTLSQTPRGRKVVELARQRVAGWRIAVPLRQAA